MYKTYIKKIDRLKDAFQFINYLRYKGISDIDFRYRTVGCNAHRTTQKHIARAVIIFFITNSCYSYMFLVVDVHCSNGSIAKSMSDIPYI